MNCTHKVMMCSLNAWRFILQYSHSFLMMRHAYALLVLVQCKETYLRYTPVSSDCMFDNR